MNDKQVVIIGAGAAGIAAGCRLLEQGWTNIQVLEAENRIGGRIFTTEMGDSIIELGAQWVHGETDNVVFNMTNPLNLLTDSVTSLFDNSTSFVELSGRTYNVEEIPHIFSKISSIDEASDEDLKCFKGSVGDYFISQFERLLKEDESFPSEDVDKAYNLLEWYEKLENSIDGSDSWYETSGQGRTVYKECSGNLLLSWKSGGYKSIFDILMKKVSSYEDELPIMKHIIFNKEVEKILWNNLDGNNINKVVVECIDGTSYTADHVIITVSLGVLKERATTLFNPMLPESKLLAIEGLGFGSVNKMFLKFPFRWWPVDQQGFNLIWSKTDKDDFKNSVCKEDRDKSWLEGVFGFYAVDNQPDVLCGWIVGSSARIMERLPEAVVLEDLMDLLQMFLGNSYDIPQPDNFQRSAWTVNPHFRGSYSFRSLESDKLQVEAAHLARPLSNSIGKQVLLFAGEATHDHFYSTVHGAIETGWREADRLINMYRHNFSRYKVAIVGAGIAGLAAAKSLLESNVKNIIVLEAQNRTGGRILSLPVEDGWVEAGAQWIHGQNNEIWRLANQYNLLSDLVSSEGEGSYIREDGVVVDPSLVYEVYNIINEILEECENLIKKPSDKEEMPISIGHHLKQKFSDYVEHCGGSQDIKNMKYELYDWHVRFQIIDNSCTSLDKLSAKAWGKYTFCGGTDYVNFKQGYSSLIKNLTNLLPCGTLHLKCPVKRVTWKSKIDGCVPKASVINGNIKNIQSKSGFQNTSFHYTNGTSSKISLANGCTHINNCDKVTDILDEVSNAPVTIECEDGFSVTADHVIITCSLGHLKKNYKTMFIPSLPQSIEQAITDLGFAAINKVYLIYEKPWWDEDTKGFQFLWLRENIVQPSVSNNSSWTRYLTGFDVLPNHKAVLLGWVGGRGAELVEQLSPEEVGEHSTELLIKFTQKPYLPKPYRVIRTCWSSNPYIRGGYSNISTYCDSSSVGPATLATPICAEVINATKSVSSQSHPVLLFAGEATHENFFSTTHGAYETGRNQAETIINYLKRSSIVVEQQS